MTLYGYDGSDFTSVRNFAGLRFVTHKATEHAPEDIYRHMQFGPVMRAARDQGIPFLGAYVVPRTGINPATQADTAIAFVRQQADWLFSHPDFFWQMDLEKWPYDAVAPEIGKQMSDALEAKTGKPVIVYVSKGQYGNTYPMDGRPLWNANYNGSGASRPFEQMYGGPSGPGWTTYSGRMPVIWQYCSDGVFRDGKVGDANAFEGSEDDFRRLITRRMGGSVPPPSTPPPAGGFKMRRLSGVTVGPLGERLIKLVETYYPEANELYVTSAYRPQETSSYHSGKSYNGSPTAAVDFGAYDDPEPNSQDQIDMGLLADWLFNNFWDLTVELIHTQPHNDHFTYVSNQQKVGAFATADHVNHIHWATSGPLMTLIEQRAAARWPGGTTPPPPVVTDPSVYNLPAGHYYGDINGPNESHGGFYEVEKPHIRYLQSRLNAHGYPSATVDGIFGQATIDATKAFQQAKGLPVDGKVGQQTWDALKAEPVTTPPPPPPVVVPDVRPPLARTRDAIVHNAKTIWPFNTVPYSMSAPRADCSSFVSRCLGLDNPDSENTVTLVTEGHVIEVPIDQAKPGDIWGKMGEGTSGSNGHTAVIVGTPRELGGTQWKVIEQAGSMSPGPDEVTYVNGPPSGYRTYKSAYLTPPPVEPPPPSTGEVTREEFDGLANEFDELVAQFEALKDKLRAV